MHTKKEETTKEEPQDFSFEKAFARLEAILETLSSGHPSLEDSLKLYEEADKLIIICGKKLQQAERKIETLVKNRAGELQMSEPQKPLTQDFLPPRE